MQIAAGAVGICCAKLGEAEVFAEAGIADIRLPYPINPINADRVVALLSRTTLSIIVDDVSVAQGWSDAMVAAGETLDVLVKVDVDSSAAASTPRPRMPPMAWHLSRRCPASRLSRIAEPRGTGLSRGLRDGARVQIGSREAEMMSDLAARATALGVTIAEISVGSRRPPRDSWTRR